MTERNLLDDDNDLESQIRREFEEQKARSNQSKEPKENPSFSSQARSKIRKNQ